MTLEDEHGNELPCDTIDELIPEPLPDTLVAPPNTIYVIPDHPVFTNAMDHFSKPSRDRDWFAPPYNYCLPLLFGNQHGFILRVPFGFVARWDGSTKEEGMRIHFLDIPPEPRFCDVSGAIGFGLLSVRVRCMLRTPENVNLLVKEPPNFPIDGLSWMDAVVESDNLRREFNFNIQVTRKEQDIYVPKGTPIGCFLPYPRYFLDKFELVELKDPEQLHRAMMAANYNALANRLKVRDPANRAKPTFAYMEGRDAYGYLFKHHQKSLDNGEWWQRVLENEEAPSCLASRIHEKTKGFYQGALSDPTDTEFGALPTAQELHFQAYLLMEKEQFEEAEKRLLRSVDLFRQFLDRDEPQWLVQALLSLGFVQRALEKIEPSVLVLEEALEVSKKGKIEPDIRISVMNNLAFAYKEQGKLDDARALLEDAKKLALSSNYEPLPLATQVEYLAFLLRDTEQYEESAQAFEEVLRLRREALGDKHEQVQQSAIDLAFTYTMLDKNDLAEKLKEQFS